MNNYDRQQFEKVQEGMRRMCADLLNAIIDGREWPTNEVSRQINPESLANIRAHIAQRGAK